MQCYDLSLGMRDDVPKVAFLLTDGTQNPKQYGRKVYDPVVSAKKLLDRGINIFAIGVGAQANSEELEIIAGDPNRVHMAEKATDLPAESFIRTIAEKTCKQSMLSLQQF